MRARRVFVSATFFAPTVRKSADAPGSENICAPPAIFALMRGRVAPFFSISSIIAGTAVSANFPTFSDALSPLLLGSII